MKVDKKGETSVKPRLQCALAGWRETQQGWFLSQLQLYLSAKKCLNEELNPDFDVREKQYLEWTTWLESFLASPPFHSANSVSQDAEDMLISRLTEDELLFVEYFGLHSRYTVLSQLHGEWR